MKKLLLKRNLLFFYLIVFSFFSVKIFVSKAQADINDGLVAYYPFNRNVYDATGNGYDGILVGAPSFVKGVVSDAIEISQDNYVRVPKSFIPGSNSFSISLYFFTEGRPEDFNITGHLPILTIQGGDFAEGVILFLERMPQNVRLGLQPGNYYYGQNIWATTQLGSWHHIAVTVDRENYRVRIYLDGILSTEEPLTISGSIDPTMDMLIGAYDYIIAREGHQRIISGNIILDELRIYNRALSEAEIQLLIRLQSFNTWVKTYGGLEEDRATYIQKTSDGGYIIAGYTHSFGSGNADFLIMKLNEFGDILWQKTYGGTGRDQPYFIQQTSDGGYIIAGYTFSFGAGNCDFWILKLDELGNIQWQKTFGGLGKI